MYDVRTVSPPKSSRLNLRVAPADETLLRLAAAESGESVSEFLIESARARAERVLADRTRFVLDDEQWKVFCESLDRPAREWPELQALFERPRPE